MKNPKPFHSQYEIVSESGCWIWMGAISNQTGYGSFRRNKKRISAHRHSYETFVGPISEGLQIDHRCRVKCCVNPAHLEAVTGRVNTLRGIGITAINAKKKFCLRGHEFTTENTRTNKKGMRTCKICQRARVRAWQKRNPEKQYANHRKWRARKKEMKCA